MRPSLTGPQPDHHRYFTICFIAALRRPSGVLGERRFNRQCSGLVADFPDFVVRRPQSQLPNAVVIGLESFRINRVRERVAGRGEMRHSLEFGHVIIDQKFGSVADDLTLSCARPRQLTAADRALLTPIGLTGRTMARTTIEDALTKIPNRFDLTIAATNRARQISAGSPPLLDADRDKPTVIALREIAAGKVGIEMLLKS